MLCNPSWSYDRTRRGRFENFANLIMATKPFVTQPWAIIDPKTGERSDASLYEEMLNVSKGNIESDILTVQTAVEDGMEETTALDLFCTAYSRREYLKRKVNGTL